MEIQLNYYELNHEKKMGDGEVIPQYQELIFIKEGDDGMMFFETHNTESKKLFWAHKKDVNFIQTSLENWSEKKINERNCYINGELL